MVSYANLFQNELFSSIGKYIVDRVPEITYFGTRGITAVSSGSIGYGIGTDDPKIMLGGSIALLMSLAFDRVRESVIKTSRPALEERV